VIAEVKTKRVVLQTEELEDSRIPFQHHRLGVDTYLGDKDALLRTQHYIRNYSLALHKGVGIIFTGKPQTFKTFLACYVLRLLMVEDKDCFYLTHRELTDAMMGDKKVFDYPINRIIRDSTFMVVDELVSSRLNPGEQRALTDLVKTRMTEGLPTIFVTELSMNVTDAAGFKAVYGNDLYRSLTEHNIVIGCSCDSRNREIQKKERFEKLVV
jgi:DNA replication protein DnaC